MKTAAIEQMQQYGQARVGMQQMAAAIINKSMSHGSWGAAAMIMNKPDFAASSLPFD
jgi:hypothetical protein